MKESVIPATMVLEDRRGVMWRPSPEYQDRETGGRGWLELLSSEGETATMREVLDRYGWPPETASPLDDGKPHLRVFAPDDPHHPNNRQEHLER